VEVTHRWRTSLKARAAVVGVTALGLALYGLLGGGAKSSVVPFQGKSVSTVQTDNYAVAVNDEPAGSIYDAVSMGPSHTLYAYWQIGGTWNGPLQIAGAGTAFSGPSVDGEDSPGGNLDVAVEGPSHTLYFFWHVESTNTWYGPLQVGAAGSTWSKPSVVVDAAGNVDVAAQGPNGSIYYYWAIGGAWKGPLQIAGAGTTLSAPSADADDSGTCSPGPSCLAVSAKGPANQNLTYWENGGTWTATSTSGQNQDYSSPTTASNGAAWFNAYVGPGQSLVSQGSLFQGGSNSYCVIAGAGTAYSAPSSVLSEEAGSSTSSSTAYNLGVQGPSHSLYAFWFTSGPSNPTALCPAFYGPLQLNGAGSTFSVPAVDSFSDGSGNTVTNMLVEGPSHTLWLYWSSNGTWNGPLQIGGAGTTFDSAN
jgi:hypothetical protein